MLARVFSPHALFGSGRDMFANLYRHRALLAEYVRRDLFETYAGQVLGGAWMFIHPIFLMLVYVFVFTVVFSARIGGTYELPGDYTSYIMSGLVPWLALQSGMTKACSSLTSHTNLIKQVVFPIEVITGKAVFASFVPLMLTMSILFIYLLFSQGSLPITVVLLPVLFLLHVMWSLGIGLILASMQIFVRDVRELVQLFSTVGVFIMPIIYLPNMVPSTFKWILYINPFSYLIWCYQDVLYFGRIEHPIAWLVTLVFAIAFYLIGARMFQGLKPYFADAI